MDFLSIISFTVSSQDIKSSCLLLVIIAGNVYLNYRLSNPVIISMICPKQLLQQTLALRKGLHQHLGYHLPLNAKVRSLFHVKNIRYATLGQFECFAENSFCNKLCLCYVNRLG